VEDVSAHTPSNNVLPRLCDRKGRNTNTVRDNRKQAPRPPPHAPLTSSDRQLPNDICPGLEAEAHDGTRKGIGETHGTGTTSDPRGRGRLRSPHCGGGGRNINIYPPPPSSCSVFIRPQHPPPPEQRGEGEGRKVASTELTTTGVELYQTASNMLASRARTFTRLAAQQAKRAPSAAPVTQRRGMATAHEWTGIGPCPPPLLPRTTAPIWMARLTHMLCCLHIYLQTKPCGTHWETRYG
jgi:hypothetical protein